MTFFGWGGVARVQWFAAFVAHSTKFFSRALPHQVIGMTTKNDLDNLDLMTNLSRDLAVVALQLSPMLSPGGLPPPTCSLSANG